MTFEIRIKTRHDCPFLDFANTFGEKHVYGYCNRQFDVLMIQGKILKSNLEVGLKLFPNFNEWKIITTGENPILSYIIMNCECESLYKNKNTVTSQIQQQGGMISYPITYKNGWEYFKILCLDKNIQKNVIQQIEKLPSFEIISINDLGDFGLFKSQMISVEEIVGNLTVKQSEILLKAYEGGYYDIPRRIRTKDIAREIEVTRYGVEKVLRSAENKVINSIIPYLYFHKEKMEPTTQLVE